MAITILKKPRPFISERRIRAKVSELAHRITHDLKKRPATLIYISNGAMIFAADLARKIPVPLRIDSIAAYSYSGKASTGRVSVRSGMKLDIRGHDVILVDDILDTGRTLSEIRRLLLRMKPSSIKICILLDKPSRRAVPIEADYAGFTIPDKFVVGYGLDHDELYRNLPYIGVI
jgi:hypoxanthine phosphoribosyltransferase